MENRILPIFVLNFESVFALLLLTPTVQPPKEQHTDEPPLGEWVGNSLHSLCPGSSTNSQEDASGQDNGADHKAEKRKHCEYAEEICEESFHPIDKAHLPLAAPSGQRLGEAN
jgi:hypothetical protein